MHMSPALNGSSAIRHFECGNAIEIRNEIIFDFHMGLPHMDVVNLEMFFFCIKYDGLSIPSTLLPHTPYPLYPPPSRTISPLPSSHTPYPLYPPLTHHISSTLLPHTPYLLYPPPSHTIFMLSPLIPTYQLLTPEPCMSLTTNGC